MLNNTKQFQINTCNETITRSAAAARKKCLSKQITTVNLKQRSAQPKKYHRHDTEGKKCKKDTCKTVQTTIFSRPPNCLIVIKSWYKYFASLSHHISIRMSLVCIFVIFDRLLFNECQHKCIQIYVRPK